MKYIFPITLVVFASFLQLTFPGHIFSLNIVVDFVFVALVLIGIFIKPATSAVWLAVLAGFLLDLWQPDQFGTWLVACLAVVGLTLLIENKLLPRITNFGLAITAVLSLTLGLTIVFLFNRVGSQQSFYASLIEYLRYYILSIPFDLILFGIGLWLTKKVIKIINPGSRVRVR